MGNLQRYKGSGKPGAGYYSMDAPPKKKDRPKPAPIDYP